MGEIRIISLGKIRGYPYPVCKKRTVGPGKTRGYPYLVCKKLVLLSTRQSLYCFSGTGKFCFAHAHCLLVNDCLPGE